MKTILLVSLLLFQHTFAQILSKKIFPSNFNQTEISIAINPTNPENLIMSCNGELLPIPPVEGDSPSDDTPKQFNQPCFYTMDGGNTWVDVNGGYAPNNVNSQGDPVVFYNLFGEAFYITMSESGIMLLKSTESGAVWNEEINIDPLSEDSDDKPHATADFSGVYINNVYVAWTDFNSTTNGEVVLVKSTDRGETFGSRVPLFPCSTTVIMGVNLQTGPNGEVYAIAAKYSEIDPNNDFQEKAFVFSKSINGGNNFSSPTQIFTLEGIRTKILSPDFNLVRVNSWPSMAVDRSNGVRRGWIYIVYSDKSTGDSDIYLRRSSDGGTTWSNKMLVNSDPSGKQQWFPSIALDQVTGNIYILL